MKKIAIVGCGRIATKHAEHSARVGKLVAVCDTRPERADDFAATHNCKAYYSLEELLSSEPDVDLVVICTPNGFHAEHTIKSLQARKDVLCEKPLCLTKAAAWQIIETEKFCRRHLYLVKSSRYNPIVKRLKQIITDGSLGRLYSFHLSCLWNRPADYYQDWKGKIFPDGGTLYNQFSHYVDVLIWLFGDVRSVKGFAANLAHPTIEVEDTGATAMEMDNGMIGSLHWSVNAYKKNHEIALTIVSEKGTVRIGGAYLNQVQYASLADEDLLSASLSFDAASYNHHKELYDHLNNVLGTNRNDFANAYDGAKTVEAIEKIYKATTSN